PSCSPEVEYTVGGKTYRMRSNVFSRPCSWERDEVVTVYFPPPIPRTATCSESVTPCPCGWRCWRVSSAAGCRCARFETAERRQTRLPAPMPRSSSWTRPARRRARDAAALHRRQHGGADDQASLPGL